MGISHCQPCWFTTEGIFCSIFEWLRSLIFTFHSPHINENDTNRKKGPYYWYIWKNLYICFFLHTRSYSFFFGGENTFSNTYIWCISCQGISNNRQGRNTAEGFFRVFDRSVCVVVFCGYRVRHVEFTVTPGRC